MTFSIDEAIASLQPLLQAEHLVADGFHLVEVRPEDGEILVRFRWSRNRHVFGIKLDLSDPSVGLTGERIRSADQWAGEVFWRLEEERNTGYLVRAERRRMADYIELHGRGYSFDSRYYVSNVPAVSDGSWLADCGLDIRPATLLRRQGRLIAWLQAYLNNAHGEPFVGQVILGWASDTAAEIYALDLVSGTPSTVARDLALVAVHAASNDGAEVVTTSLTHPELRSVGFRPGSDGSLWINSDLIT